MSCCSPNKQSWARFTQPLVLSWFYHSLVGEPLPLLALKNVPINGQSGHSEYRKYLNLTSWIPSDSNAQSNIVNYHWRIPSQILTTTWSPTARRLLMAAVLYVCCVANGAGICTTWGSTLRLLIHISPPAISANSVPRSSRVITAGKSIWKSIIESQ